MQSAHQRFPARFDHVLGNAHRGPTALVVRPFHQNARLRRGALFGIEDTDLVIRESYLTDARQCRETLSQTGIESVNRALPVRGLDTVAAARADADGGRGARRFGAPAHNHHLIALHVEKLHARIQRLADEEFEGAVRRFEIVALVLGFLHTIHQRAARFVVQASRQRVVLAQHVIHVAATGKIADQNALAVAHQFRRDVFVGLRIFEHRADVNAALVRECAGPDIRLSTRDLQVREVGDITRDGSQSLELVRADGFIAQLQLQIRDDAGEVGVAAALAIAVQAALHMCYAFFDRRQRIGHRDIGIVVRMNPDFAFELRPHVADDLGEKLGQRAAVGIAQAEHVRAGCLRRLQSLQRIFPVVNVAVEEMLGVINHFFAVRFQVSHGL